MRQFFSQIYFQLQIMGLILFKPEVLFDRINQLQWYKKAHQLWFDDLNLPAESKILELGCASGALTSYMASQGHSPIGVDASAKMIDLAKKKNSQIDFVKASALELPFKDQTFDMTLAASLLNIIPDKTQFLSEIYRVCKPGGRVSLLVPSSQFSDKDFDALKKYVDASGFSAAAMRAWHSKPPKMYFSEIVDLLESAGFTEYHHQFYLQKMVIAVTAVKPH